MDTPDKHIRDPFPEKFTGLWIPVEILRLGLGPLDAMLLAQVASFDDCTVTHRTLAERFNGGRLTAVAESLKRLEDRGYLRDTDTRKTRKRLQAVVPGFSTTGKSVVPGDGTSCTGRRYKVVPESGNKRKEEQTRKTNSALFEDFWKSFTKATPSRPGSKANASREFQKLLKAEVDPQEITAGLRRFAEHHRRLKEAGEFAPNWKHAERWLKGREFESELPAEPDPFAGVTREVSEEEAARLWGETADD